MIKNYSDIVNLWKVSIFHKLQIEIHKPWSTKNVKMSQLNAVSWKMHRSRYYFISILYYMENAFKGTIVMLDRCDLAYQSSYYVQIEGLAH